ncbi:MAG: hypothetical protein ACK51A_09685 [Sphingobacteriia bacterium]|jgi:hypothetical protein
MRHRILTYSLLFALAAVCAGPAPVLAQCPMCKSNVESAQREEQKAVGKGLNVGILFLMTTPYLLVGTLAFVWMRRRRSKPVAHD